MVNPPFVGISQGTQTPYPSSPYLSADLGLNCIFAAVISDTLYSLVKAVTMGCHDIAHFSVDARTIEDALMLCDPVNTPIVIRYRSCCNLRPNYVSTLATTKVTGNLVAMEWNVLQIQHQRREENKHNLWFCQSSC